uniref:Apolipoprotein C-I n=1 Tax=Mesocestoides corti TaxID=53468 RepID=A0A5K3FNP9_MESCO
MQPTLTVLAIVVLLAAVASADPRERTGPQRGIVEIIKHAQNYLRNTPDGQKVTTALGNLQDGMLQAYKATRTLLAVYIKGLLAENE